MLKFVDEIYAMYRNHLTGAEEDAVALVLNLLQEHSKDDIVKAIKDMDENEIFQMFALYLIEMLKVKMSEESTEEGEVGYNSDSNPRFH